MREQKHETEMIFTVVTFLVYALALLMFASLSASVYHSVTERMEQHQAQRTAENYLREKIRQNDRSGAVSIGEIEGLQALKIEDSIDGKTYETYIYVQDGMLKELFISAEKEAKAEEGTALLGMSKIAFEEKENGYLAVTFWTAQNQKHLFLIKRKGDHA